MAFDLDSFRNKMQDGGARPSLFEMEINFPLAGSGVNTENARFLTKVSEIPGSSVGVIEVPYFGRKLKIAGDRTFATLSVTILNDEAYALRAKFEQWMDKIARHEVAVGSTRLDFYQVDLALRQLKRSGGMSAEYIFVSAFPTALGTIALDWSSEAIEEYTVEFQYQYWTSSTLSQKNIDIDFSASIN
jgi:hypothetical protein